MGAGSPKIIMIIVVTEEPPFIVNTSARLTLLEPDLKRCHLSNSVMFKLSDWYVGLHSSVSAITEYNVPLVGPTDDIYAHIYSPLPPWHSSGSPQFGITTSGSSSHRDSFSGISYPPNQAMPGGLPINTSTYRDTFSSSSSLSSSLGNNSDTGLRMQPDLLAFASTAAPFHPEQRCSYARFY
jgi:hypothetical protein